MSATALETVQHVIGRRTTPGASLRTAPVWDPAEGTHQRQVLLAAPADVDAAVRTAHAAFQEWREVSVTRRSRVMFAFRNLVEQHLDELAELVSREHGKVVADASGEVVRGMEVAEFASGIPQLLKGEFS